MNNNFFIIGRPRSRTAWAANLMTVHRHTFCIHEGLGQGGFLSLQRRMANLPAKYKGNADSGLIHHPEALLESFPLAQFVILTENEPSWRMWVSKHKVPEEVVKTVDYAYWKAKQVFADRALFLPCDAITTDLNAARALWTHCTGRLEGWSDARWAMLKDLNIQVKPTSLLSRPH